ncbi:MAG: iron-containing alcohol dehydrogenase [Bacteroidales bacterium]|jgi:alcohol dehydrogenase class IV
MVDTLNAFSFAATPKIIFGEGSISSLGKHASGFGRSVLLVTGGSSYHDSSIKEKAEMALESEKLHFRTCPVSGEPSPETIDRAVDEFRTAGTDIVIAVGGGSVMDAGKAISAMMKEEGSVKDYLEGVGSRQPSGKKMPFIAVPTTAGTGSEATKNAVISEFGRSGFKKSLRHENYVPDLAIVDPALAIHCPPEVTAASGMDAFTQLMESCLSVNAGPVTDALSFSGLRCIAGSLTKAFYHGNDLRARSEMAYAALMSGITLSNAGLGVIHGFAQPLGSLFPIPHGVVCGGLMGVVNRITVGKLRESKPDSIFLNKYRQIAELFIDRTNKNEHELIDAFLDLIDRYIDEMNIPRLGQYGVSEADLQRIAKLTGMKNHPVSFAEEELYEIIRTRL